MSIEIVPTGAALGAEIRGVNLARPIDDETFAAIERAYNDHGVIFFRDQHITPPRQVAFTRRFGEIEFNIFGERWSVPGGPEIVVFSVSDPVERGLVASLARPGGNLTGVSSLDLIPKRLDLLSQLVPQANVIALLVNPSNATAERAVEDAEEAARTKGLQLRILKASTESEIETAFATLVELQAGALILPSDPYLNSRREQVVALAARLAVPTMYDWREWPAAGGLISYGMSLPAAYRLVGVYAGKILKGAKPADLPVQQPTTFELVVNLKTAKALGLTVPQSILARADEVIE
jgi:putative tryptophan/tyrosine transport system substrate-binding protein